MAFSSRVTYTGSTSTGPYSFSSIALFDDSIVPLQTQVVVTVSGVVQTYTSGAPGAGEYSMDKVLSTITLGSAPAANDTVKIKRSTSSSAYVDFTNNSPLTAADLDIATQQALFLAEEGIDAIEAGDAVLSLPELTDTDPTMSPNNGDFLRWSDANSRWEARSFTPEGTGPEVNIVTSFPVSPSAGDLIYHSVYGAAYIYDGSSWQFINGSGAVTTAAPGTTVTELTFGTEGSLDTLSLTTGWHCFIPVVPDGAGVLPCVPIPHLTTTDGDWVDITDPTQSVSGTAQWHKLWVATGLSNFNGDLVIDNSTFRTEGTTASVGHQNICGDGTAGSAQQWWGGATESNAALSATAVLCPRFVTGTAEDDLTGYISSTGESFRMLMWGYNAGINWGTQDWRITCKFVAFQPGWNGNINQRHFAVSFLPANWPYLAKDANGWTVTQATDVNGLVALANNDHADVRETFGHILGFYTGNGSSTSFSSYLVGHPGVFASRFTLSGPTANPSTVTNPITNGDTTAFLQLGSPDTQNSANPEDIQDYCLAYTITIEYTAASGVAVISLVPDSSEEFALPTTFTYSTPVAAGDYLRDYLSSCGPDVFITHGSGNSQYIDTTSNWPDALTSIKIETL